ncbi:selenium-binding protein SBP56-related protein, partial [Thermus sp.]|uniref:selenium-binding protein SBP56-related protein n=1 Tax=Thermus sp. TaxID=275 RepID=UPI0025DE80F0
MGGWRPDPTLYPSPRAAAKAPPEELAYVVFLNADRNQPDAIQVVDVNPTSSTYGQVIGEAKMPYAGGELHHFGWNACSSMLCPSAPHPHLERRYLVVPDIRSSHITILDTKPDPTRPKVVKVIPPEELHERTGYSRPHTVHCGPDGIYVSALGSPEGKGPGGILVLDHESFEPLGQWEIERGDQYLHYDFWWHLGYDTLISSEWGTPEMVEHGVLGEALLQGQYGHRLHFWDLHRRRLLASLDLGAKMQMALELRPAHDPTRAYG